LKLTVDEGCAAKVKRYSAVVGIGLVPAVPQPTQLNELKKAVAWYVVPDLNVPLPT